MWVRDGRPTQSIQVHLVYTGPKKPRVIVPEVGTPEDFDESDWPHEGKMRNKRLYHSMPRRENVISNLFQVFKLYVLRKLHVHTIISISVLHIYSIV